MPDGSFTVEDKQKSVACIPQAIATPFSGGIHAFRRSVVVQSTQRRTSLFKATQFSVISRRSNQSSAGQGGGSEGFLHGPTKGDPNHSAIPHLLMRGILKRAQPPSGETHRAPHGCHDNLLAGFSSVLGLQVCLSHDAGCARGDQHRDQSPGSSQALRQSLNQPVAEVPRESGRKSVLVPTANRSETQL